MTPALGETEKKMNGGIGALLLLWGNWCSLALVITTDMKINGKKGEIKLTD